VESVHIDRAVCTTAPIGENGGSPFLGKPQEARELEELPNPTPWTARGTTQECEEGSGVGSSGHAAAS